MKAERKVKFTDLFYVFIIIALLFFVSCSNDSEDDFIDNGNDIENPMDGDNGDSGDDDDDDDNNQSTVNYVDDIAPIMNAACVSCHGQPPTNGAPFALVNFSQVSQRANGIFNRMNLSSGAPGAMPPSGRLPQSTIDLIQEWIDAGLPEE